MDKPTIYICLEIKNREYESQILLAADAVLRGYRVYLGTHAAVYALIKTKKSKNGIFLDKSTQPLDRMIWVRERCEALCVLDVELGPTILESDLRGNFISRIYKDTEKLIDKFMVVGPAVEQVAKEHFTQDRSKIIKTGWPRIDLWVKQGELIHKDTIASIRDKYGDFLLFTSSFGIIRDPNLTGTLKNADTINATSLNSIGTFDLQFSNFKKTIELIKKWDANLNVPAIVIRPHPAEPLSIWRRELGKLQKTFIVSDGEVTPWILASLGIIHQGSTSAIQAYYAKKPVLMLTELTNPVFKPVVSSISSYLLDSSSQFSGYNFSRIEKNPEFDPTFLNQTIFNPKDGSIRRIIDVFDELKVRPISHHRRAPLLISQLSRKSLRRAVGLLRDEIYWNLGKTNINSQLHFVPGGLDKKRIEMVLKIDSAFSKVKYRRMTINLWEFDA